MGCYSVGECLDAVFNNYNNNATTPEDCHLLCIGSTDCMFWTHYVNADDPEDTVCFAYLNCPGFGTECGGNECLSGEVECPVQGLVCMTFKILF